MAWDTYADDGRIEPDKLQRVGEVVDWITGAGMFCVLNIHWDGGWIDSDQEGEVPQDLRHLQPRSGEEVPFVLGADLAFFAGKNEKLIFEALNEETNFTNEGSRRRPTPP